MSVDTASSQPGDLVLPIPAEPATAISAAGDALKPDLDQNLIQQLWLAAEGAECGLTSEEFGCVLTSSGQKVNYGLAAGYSPDATQRAAFLRSLHLAELALAHSCVLGRDAAWQRFLTIYRSSLTQAAIAITGSATVGHELADSLYGELYGLRELDGQRRSPLASYSGRGSLLGWLRTTLAQRYVDYHRRTRREAPLDNVDPPAAEASGSPASVEILRLKDAVSRSLQALPAEDRFVLSAYFLDRQSLLEISRVIRVHEATVSRRLKRLAADLRKQLIQNLQSGGLSKRASEEALGADPRDIELNLRALLQTSQTPPFSDKTASVPIVASDKV
jgi:RNA polymerase sigma-70 factor (ECF subfamily)